MNYLLPKKGMPGMKQFWKRGDWSFRKQEKSREKEKKLDGGVAGTWPCCCDCKMSVVLHDLMYFLVCQCLADQLQ